MNLMKPDSNEHRLRILSNLTSNVACRIGIRMKPYDASTVKDRSGSVHWMYIFDQQESRTYGTQNGTQRMADVELDGNKLMDLDDLASLYEVPTFFEGI